MERKPRHKDSLSSSEREQKSIAIAIGTHHHHDHLRLQIQTRQRTSQVQKKSGPTYHFKIFPEVDRLKYKLPSDIANYSNANIKTYPDGFLAFQCLIYARHHKTQKNFP